MPTVSRRKPAATEPWKNVKDVIRLAFRKVGLAIDATDVVDIRREKRGIRVEVIKTISSLTHRQLMRLLGTLRFKSMRMTNFRIGVAPHKGKPALRLLFYVQGARAVQAVLATVMDGVEVMKIVAEHNYSEQASKAIKKGRLEERHPDGRRPSPARAAKYYEAAIDSLRKHISQMQHSKDNRADTLIEHAKKQIVDLEADIKRCRTPKSAQKNQTKASASPGAKAVRHPKYMRAVMEIEYSIRKNLGKQPDYVGSRALQIARQKLEDGFNPNTPVAELVANALAAVKMQPVAGFDLQKTKAEQLERLQARIKAIRDNDEYLAKNNLYSDEQDKQDSLHASALAIKAVQDNIKILQAITAMDSALTNEQARRLRETRKQMQEETPEQRHLYQLIKHEHKAIDSCWQMVFSIVQDMKRKPQHLDAYNESIADILKEAREAQTELRAHLAKARKLNMRLDDELHTAWEKFDFDAALARVKTRFGVTAAGREKESIGTRGQYPSVVTHWKSRDGKSSIQLVKTDTYGFIIRENIKGERTSHTVGKVDKTTAMAEFKKLIAAAAKRGVVFHSTHAAVTAARKMSNDSLRERITRLEHTVKTHKAMIKRLATLPKTENNANMAKQLKSELEKAETELKTRKADAKARKLTAPISGHRYY